MKSVFRKTLAVLSAALMLITALSTMVYAAAPAAYTTITLDTEYTAVIEKYDELAYFQFIPEVSGTYNFVSHADFDTYGHLYNAEMEEIARDDDSGENSNFSVAAPLIAGETYYFGARRYNREPDSFTVTLSKMPGVTNIVVDPVSMIENCGGSWDERWNDITEDYDTYYRYYWWNNVTYTVYLDDGRTLSGNGSYCYDQNETSYRVDSTDNQYDECWTLGNTYTAQISLWGYTANVPVTIVESPVKKVQVAPVSLIEECEGGWNYYYDEHDVEQRYFNYAWYNNLSYTITMKDGSVIKGEGNYFDYNGVEYRVDSSDNQSCDNQWVVGGNYTVSITVLGYKVDVSVAIVESPVVDTNMQPVEIVENTKGDWEDIWNDEGENVGTYYRYRWWNQLKGTITLNDGTVLTANGGGFYDDDENWHSVSHDDIQSSENPWIVGNTYYPTISVLGKTVTIPVIITEHPIAAIELSPIYLDPDNDSWEDESWDEELGEWVSYNRYSWRGKVAGTITMKDGTVVSVNTEGFTYKDEWYNCEAWTNDEQNVNNPWVVGGVYTAYFEAMGITVETPIYIVEPLVSDNVKYIEQEDGIIIAGTTGEGDTLTIPSTIGDKPVVAITSLRGGYWTEIIIPDSVTSLSSNMAEDCWDLQKITIGAGVTKLSDEMFYWAESLKEIIVSANNPNYTSVDGVVYDEAVTTMVAIPRSKNTSHTVPATATNIELYVDGQYNFSIVLQNAATGYVIEDGVMYNADKTMVISCDPNKTGNYVMPNTVTTIDSMAFWGTQLESVTVSSKVTDIVYYSFADSSSLKKVVLPEGLQSIGFHAFSGCGNLTDIALPSTVTMLDTSCFASSGVRKITIPAGVEYIGNSAFAYSDLESLTIKNGVKEIGGSAFYATKLKSVTLPNSIRDIDSSAFANSTLQSVKFGTGDLWIYAYAFSDTKLTSVSIPANVKFLGEGAFSGCPIKTLTMADGITSTGDSAFYDNNLTSLTLPNSVTTVAYYSFASNDNLATIDLPSKLQHLCGHAFDGSAWLKKQANGVVYLEQALYGYKGTMPANTTVVVKEGTTIIADYAFDSGYYEDWEYVTDNKLTKVILPKSIKTIGYAAFAGCAGIKDVYYTGTEAEAKKIFIDEDNDYLQKATWHYNYKCKHKYSNDCDKNCNTCGATRSTSHSYEKKITKATLTKDGIIKNVCKKCGYTASKTTVLYKASKISLSDTTHTYTGNVKKPSVVVKDSKGKTISSSNYTVTYASGRKNVGKYKVTVKFKGNYSGTKTLYFTISPAKTTQKTPVAAKKALTVKWTKKSTQVTGYQIQYSTSKSFKSYKTKTVSSYKTTSTKLTGLKAKTTYYVRVRTYKTVGGVKYYSGWSTIKY
ncbi:MAG: leucine-rich repeat protein, partial [Clostridia bacterium]|nr:leucine-rich repeat protein [Clostridia bacterium]